MKRMTLVLALLLVPVVAAAGGSARAGRFRIWFVGPNDPALDRAFEAFAEADRHLTPLLGEGARGSMDVVIARSAREYVSDVGAAPGSLGAFLHDSQDIVIRPPEVLEKSGLLGTVARHEAVHAFLGRRWRGPRWVNEGAAVHFSGDDPTRFGPAKTFASDRELDDAFRAPYANVGSAYREAGLRVARLVRECGEHDVAAWLRALRTDPDAAIGGRDAPCPTQAW